MVLVAAIAAFITVFSLVAVKSLVGQMSYNNRVIDTKKAALSQLEDNIKARDRLVSSYYRFVGQDTNIINGSSAGEGGSNGDNAQIITDALPYTYDFPALTTSLESIIVGDGLTIGSISGIDDQVQQQANSASPDPEAVVMPFELQVSGSYNNLQKLTKDMQRSIRPLVIQEITISSASEDMSMQITANTYYQPAKEFKITKEVVKPWNKKI